MRNVRLIQDGKIWQTTGRKYRMAISDELVRAIRTVGPGKPVRVTAELLDVHPSTVHRVLKGRAYRHVA